MMDSYPTQTNIRMPLLPSRVARNNAIRADWKALKAKRYENSYVIEKLMAKYFLAESTLWAILQEKGHYQRTK